MIKKIKKKKKKKTGKEVVNDVSCNLARSRLWILSILGLQKNDKT
jgi:hypothetical protein